MSLDDLQHPDCRACEERKRLSLGQLAEIGALKKKLDEAGTSDKPLRELLSAVKVWRNATESRLKMLNGREALDTMIPADRALIEAATRIEAEERDDH